MNNGYINKLSLTGPSLGASFRADLTGYARQVQSPGAAHGANFMQTLGNVLNEANQTMSAPDALMNQAMSGVGGVDVHDVMIANAKAEMVINVGAQVATKVVQAYDKILQIQI